MKYIVILADGMADYPLAELDGKTPMGAARKPEMDRLAAKGVTGLARTLYEGLPTGSDTANLSVLGYDPKKYYTGRSPIEAVGLGIPLEDDDTVFRLNLVTLSQDDGPFAGKTILDHSAGKITNEEAYELLDALRDEFASPDMRFYRGVSYRHILVWSGIDYGYTMTPPHDILGRVIGDYLPGGPYGKQVLSMMERSYALLSTHPVNIRRIQNGLSPANCMWLWGEGKKPRLDSFEKKYGVRGSVITAVPLIMGLAAGMGLGSVEVEGATGEYHTNYRGKADAALAVLRNEDFVFVHIEAPDECGHDGDIELKVKSIERIDAEVISPIIAEMNRRAEDYRVLVMPDHATPICVRTHTIDPVPFAVYDSRREKSGAPVFNEQSAAAAGLMLEDGYTLMGRFIKSEI